MTSEIFFWCIGVFMGWVVIPQPDWAQSVWNWIKKQFMAVWREYLNDGKGKTTDQEERFKDD